MTYVFYFSPWSNRWVLDGKYSIKEYMFRSRINSLPDEFAVIADSDEQAIMPSCPYYRRRRSQIYY